VPFFVRLKTDRACFKRVCRKCAVLYFGIRVGAYLRYWLKMSWLYPWFVARAMTPRQGRAGTRSLESIAPAKNTLRSCNNHVTISFSCGGLEVLQYHLRPLCSCKAAKDGHFHGGNTAFQRNGVHPRLVCRKLPFGKVIICRCEGENNSDTLGAYWEEQGQS
jgi:hypothetical protein